MISADQMSVFMRTYRTIEVPSLWPEMSSLDVHALIGQVEDVLIVKLVGHQLQCLKLPPLDAVNSCQ